MSFFLDSALAMENELNKNFIVDLFFNPFFYVFIAFSCMTGIILYYKISKVEKRNKEILEKLDRDDLTSLLSVAAFKEKLSQILLNAKENEYEIIVFDIDHFRVINKYFGRAIGLEIIKSMGKTLQQAYLASDTYLSRLNAEEFIICKKVDEGIKIDKLIDLFILPTVQSILGKNYNLSISAGLYRTAGIYEKAIDVIDYADLARLKGKKHYKTTINYFNDELREEILDTVEITFQMQRALKEKEFFVKYQAKVDFQTFEIIGAEALVRWLPPSNVQIYPDRFIKVMETNGFILELDLYVFKEVCKFISDNSQKKQSVFPKIAVNFSPITMSEPQIVEVLEAILKRFNVSSSQIEIELTESAFVNHEKMILERINSLRKLGFTVAIDDFGTGISSLNRLSVMEVDVLKLDKSFLFANQGERGSIVVEEIILLAQRLGMKIVSEGVETKEQVENLRSLNCDIAQGYYFSRPISEIEFLDFLDKGIEIDIK